MRKKYTELTEEEKKLFEVQLNREILFSERLRVVLMGSTYFFLLIVFLILTTILKSQLSGIIIDFTPMHIVAGLFAIFTLREFIIKKYIDRVITEQIILDYTKRDKIRFINIIGEISIPSFILLVFAFYYEAYIVLSTPVVLLYLIMIMLTTLSLNAKISFTSGIVAAVEYFIIIVIFLKSNDNSGYDGVLVKPYIYYAKSIIIFAGGCIAAVISSQLRKRIFSSYASVIEQNRIINLFGQQVSQQIVDELVSAEEEISSKRKFVCIMFLDIRGFTSYAEKREPEEIIEYQNKVFGFMIDAITRNKGIINQFLGDGYMATFGAPVSHSNDCQNALNAALEIINILEKKNSESDFDSTRIGIGLHAGYVVAGNVGTNIRKQYSISGNTVILASRIEQLNKQFNSQLLVSEEVLNNVDTSGIQYESLGDVNLKGREKPVKIYKISQGT